MKWLSVLALLVLTFIGCMMTLMQKDTFQSIANYCRVLISDQLLHITEGTEGFTEEYPYQILSLDGKVIVSTREDRTETVSLENLSFNMWTEGEKEGTILYCAPFIEQEKITKLVLFELPKEEVDALQSRSHSKPVLFSVVVFTGIGIIYVIFHIYHFVCKDILYPIQTMHKSATEILKGNYYESVTYDYYGEIGQFAHDFEQMRDSLVDASQKEAQLKVAEKELLACISHDLKTPISNISGYCEGILDGVVTERVDVQRYAGIILKKAKALTKLVDNILELSKAELQQMSIRKKEVYAKEYFEELIEEISIDVITNGRQFVLEGEIPNLLIQLDEERIAEAINNVISNAIKYTKENGRIVIQFEKIQEGIKIHVSDNGIGLAAEEIPLVFKKFYRGEKHRNQNIPGSGLGLSIAKYILELHYGSIEMQSNKEKGTTVSLTIRNEID